jgi:hypothetical protein
VALIGKYSGFRFKYIGMKKLTIIEVFLTIIFVIVNVTILAAAGRLIKMRASDPVHEHLLQSRMDSVLNPVFQVTFCLWIFFTVIYLIILFIYLGAWIFRKLTGEDKADSN